jgi:hypothetical protein
VEVKGVEAVAEECCFHRETMPRDAPGGRQWVLLRGGAWKAVDLPHPSNAFVPNAFVRGRRVVASYPAVTTTWCSPLVIDEIGVGTVPGSNFYASDPALGRGLVRFAFPKKDETPDAVEERFKKLPGIG